MALQVWLPLTKDLRNQGIDNITVTTANTNVFQNEGKLSNLSLDVSGHYAFRVPSLVKKRVFSCSFWYKPITNSSYSDNWRRIIVFDTYTSDGSTAGAIFRFESSYGYQSSSTQYCISIHNNVGEPIASIGTGLGSTDGWNQWQHITITADGTTLRCYRNGTQIASGNMGNGGMLQGTVHIGYTGNRPIGRLNDFRLYDHCLSPMEVKELAKGLVLHYPLNRNSWGQENLIPGTNQGTTNWGWTMQAGNYTASEETVLSGVRGCKLTRGTTAQSGWSVIYYNNVNESLLKSSTAYKISLDIYPSVSTSFVVSLRETNGTNAFTGASAGKSVVANKWNHIEFDVTTVATLPSSTAQVLYFQSMNSGTGVYYIFKNVKMEEGSIATPWCPNSSDALAITMGLNSTTEYDCSGFENNGVWHGTHTNTSDAPKYTVSTTATGNETTYLEGSILPAEAKTVALWIKNTSKSSNGAIFNDKTSGLQIGLLNSLLYMNSAISTAGFTTTHWINGEWNHVVAVNNNGTRSLYVNGQAETQSGASNYYIHNADNCWVWNRSYNNNYPFTGSLCDLRVYATALSADDIAELYSQGRP